MGLALASVSVDGNGVPSWVRKGKGVPHYWRVLPVVLGPVDVVGLCGVSLGRSFDGSLAWGGSAVDGVCRNCVRVYGRLEAERAAERESYVSWWVDTLLHGALVDLLRVKVRCARGAGGSDVRGAMACVHPGTGEPVTARGDVTVEPVAGSVREVVSGVFRGEGIDHVVCTGTCPFCSAHVPLSGKGMVTAHTQYAVGVPAPKGKLTDRQTIPVDVGARVGDPESGDKRRGLDIDGVFARGVVPGHDPVTFKPVKDDEGHQVDVPATAVNVRAVLEYWKRKRINPPKDGSSPEIVERWRSRQANQSARVVRYTRMLRAYEGASAPRYDKGIKAYVVPAARNVPLFGYDESSDAVTVTNERGRESMEARHSPEGLQTPHTVSVLEPSPVSGEALTASQAMAGPASYKGRALPAMAGPVTVRRAGEPVTAPEPCVDTRTGWEGKAGTLAGSLGRERMDREILGERPKARFGKAKSANYRKKMRRQAAKGTVPVKGALAGDA